MLLCGPKIGSNVSKTISIGHCVVRLRKGARERVSERVRWICAPLERAITTEERPIERLCLARLGESKAQPLDEDDDDDYELSV